MEELNPTCGVSIPYGVTVCVTVCAGYILAGGGFTVSGAWAVLVGTGQQLREAGELLWPRTFMLTVTVPTGVQVTVDGLPYYSADGLPLLEGQHSIGVPELFQVDAMHRFRFAGWSDGYTSLNRYVDISSDTTL